MNFYGSEEYFECLGKLDAQIFSKCDLENPTDEIQLDEHYKVKYYYYADEENAPEGWLPIDGTIARLYKDNELIFEWKNIDGGVRLSKIIHHADGNQYFLFDEDLYGYGILNLSNLECMHYIPMESHKKIDDGFRETIIWCDAHYDKNSNYLAVEGCIWGAPYTVIVLDFSNPIEPVIADKWIDIQEKIDPDYEEYEELNFKEWIKEGLVCDDGSSKHKTVQISFENIKKWNC